MIFAYAVFRVPDAARVDEIVQRKFIRAYEQLANFKADQDLGVWLRAICRFVIPTC